MLQTQQPLPGFSPERWTTLCLDCASLLTQPPPPDWKALGWESDPGFEVVPDWEAELQRLSWQERDIFGITPVLAEAADEREHYDRVWTWKPHGLGPAMDGARVVGLTETTATLERDGARRTHVRRRPPPDTVPAWAAHVW